MKCRRIETTQEDYEKLLDKWKKKLRLQDWDINVKVVNRLNGALGNCLADHKYKYANIKLCSIIPKAYAGPVDPEVLLVHEMLHVHFSPLDEMFTEGSTEDLARETIIDQLALSMVAMDRGLTNG